MNTLATGRNEFMAKTFETLKTFASEQVKASYGTGIPQRLTFMELCRASLPFVGCVHFR